MTDYGQLRRDILDKAAAREEERLERHARYARIARGEKESEPFRYSRSSTGPKIAHKPRRA